MKFCFLFFGFCLLLPVQYLCAQKAVWARDLDAMTELQPVGQAHAKKIVTDKFSNVFSLSLMGFKIVVTKHNKSGDLVWVKIIKVVDAVNHQYTDNLYSIDVNSQGEVYISGMYIDDSNNDFDPGAPVVNLSAAGYTDLFVEKLDSAGNFQWVKQLGGIDHDRCGSMKVDKQDNVVFTGEVSGTVYFNPGAGQYTSTGFDNDMFVCKISGAGSLTNFIRIGQASDKGFQEFNLSIDPFNNIAITGQYYSYSNSIDFDPGPGTSYLTPGITLGDMNAFVLKLGTDLDFKWAKQINKIYQPSSIAHDPSGNIYFAGLFNNTIDTDPGPGIFTMSPLSSSYDIYLIKLNPAGNFIFAKQIGTGDFEPPFLAVDNDGNLFVTGRNSRTTDFDPGPGIANLTPPASTAAGFILKLNSVGSYLWCNQFTTSAGVASSKAIAVESDNYLYSAGNFDVYLYFNSGYLNVNATQSPDVYIAKIADANNITGTVFYDLNGNGTKDAGEAVMQGILLKAVSATKTFYGISNGQGFYNMATDTGNYNITLPQLPLYYSSSVPSAQAASFGTSLGKIDSLNHFGLVPLQNKNDLKISISGTTISRPGRTTIYHLTYKNVGTTTVSGSVSLTHSTLLNYVSSSPAAVAYTNPILTWNFNNLSPSATGDIDIIFQVPSTALAGTLLQSIASVSPVSLDETPADNSETYNDTTRSSYDPNGKYVTPANQFYSEFISQGRSLDYTIRFQNTGNDTAFNIVISDTLDNLLDVNSFEFVSASHSCSSRLLGSKVIEWKFSNIMLPDSNHNEPGSHGYVRFRIRPKNTILEGNQVKNTAYIGFDFNPYIVTNQTVNTYATPFVSIADGDWTAPATWAGGIIPPSGSKVIIRHHVNANINTSCASITVELGTGLLTVKSGITLKVTNQ